MEDFESLNLVPTFDESLWMNSETLLENPPKLSIMEDIHSLLVPPDLKSFSVSYAQHIHYKKNLQ